MTEVNEVFSTGTYLWPWSECFSPLSFPFYSPSHSGCLLVCWLFFPLIVFPGSGESCRDMCICACVCLKSTVFEPWHQPSGVCVFFSVSCAVVFYNMVKVSPYKQLQFYLPHLWKHSVLACLLFDLTCHNIVVHWVSKQLSKTVFSWREYEWNSWKILLCRFVYCTTVGHICHRKGPLIPRGGSSKLFVREKHECKLNTREPGQMAKSNSVLCRTL